MEINFIFSSAGKVSDGTGDKKETVRWNYAKLKKRKDRESPAVKAPAECSLLEGGLSRSRNWDESKVTSRIRWRKENLKAHFPRNGREMLIT